MARILLTYPIFPEIIRSELAGHELVTCRSRRALLRELPRADALITLLSDRVDRALLDQAPRLRAIANYAVGVNNIDLAECRKRRIRVCNTPGVLTQATAELTLALLLACARRLPEGEALCRKNRFQGWAPDLLLGQELAGRRALLVGSGRIGRETARLFRALGMKVAFLPRHPSPAQLRKQLSQAQVLSLHVPLTPETHHWLDARKLALLPRDAIVLNTSRGPVHDEKALISALKKRRIFAAGLDVFEHEPRIPASLRRAKNVVLLPHLGSATGSTREAMARLACRGLAGILRGRAIPNEVK